MQYQINLDIDDAGLKAIYDSGQSVTLVKSVVGNPLVTGNLPIAWLSFQPLEENQIVWTENYYAYATTTSLQAGAVISMTSQSPGPMQAGWLYTFEDGQFASAPGGAAGTLNVFNDMQSNNFNFGLAQQATINNVATSAPLNSQPVLYNESASFTPIETLSIFLSSYSNNGVVLTQVASNALVLSLTSQNPTINVGFNDANNTFYVASESARSAEDLARGQARRRAALA